MRKQIARMIACLLIIATVATGISWEHFIVTTHAKEVSQEAEPVVAKEEQEADVTVADVTREEADLSENTEYSTTYQVGRNKKMTIFYQEPIRFQDEKGNLTEYDPSLIKITEDTSDGGNDLEGYRYENAEGDKKQYFPESISEETPILMENGEYTVTMTPVETAEETENVSVEEKQYTNAYEETEKVPLTAVYQSAEQDISYAFTSTEFGVKEETVLHSVPESNVFEYQLRLDHMTVRKNGTGGGITLYDAKTGDIVGSISAPNMNDATEDAYSEAAEYTLEQDKEDAALYHLKLTVSKEYLEDSDRQYPVTIDPTINWIGSADVNDVYVIHQAPYRDTNFYDSGVVVMNCGKGSKGVYRTYMSFILLKTQLRGYYVDKATLTLYETGNSSSGQNIQVHRVQDSWSKGAITWNNRPGYDGTPYSTVKSTGVGKTARTLDLTEFCRGMANNSIPSHGIMIRGGDETAKYTEFYSSRYSSSSYRPKLAVTYYDPPTKPDSVSITASTAPYVKKGTAITAKWSGISSKSLASVQYKLMKCNADGTVGDEVSAYKKLGTGASGSAAISGSNTWAAGEYYFYIRGLDHGGIAGPSTRYKIIIDGTVPVLGKAVIVTPKTTESASSRELPTIKWESVSDTYLNQIEYSMDGKTYKKAGTGTSGTFKLPASAFSGAGDYTIHVRASDKALNYSTVQKLSYYYDEETMDLTKYQLQKDSLKIEKQYGKNVISWVQETELPSNLCYEIYKGSTKDFTPSAQTMAATDVQDSYWADMQSIGTGTSYYKVKLVRKKHTGAAAESLDIAGTLTIADTKKDVYEKQTGIKGYYGVMGYSTPAGNGTIEKSSGNVTYQQEDIDLPTAQLPFAVTRYYNSQLETTGVFGAGWGDSLHKELNQDAEGTVYFTDSDGSVYAFQKEADHYVCSETKDFVLSDETTRETEYDFDLDETKLDSEYIGEDEYVTGETEEDVITASHKYTVKTKDNMLYRFNESGQLVSVVEPNMTFLLYSYDQNGTLTSVKTEAGKEIQLSYDGDTRFLTEIQLPDETTLHYTYADEKLTKMSHISKEKKELVSYIYGYGSDSGKVTSVSDGEGNVYEISYTGARGSKVTYPNGESYSLVYMGMSTAVKKYNEAGAEIYTTYTIFDLATGKVIKEVDVDGNEIDYVYESTANPYLVTKITSLIEYQSIEHGKVVFHTAKKTDETIYDDHENVVSETDENGETTIYRYATANSSKETVTEWNVDQPLLEVTKSEQGAVIGQVAYQYEEHGEVQKEIDFTDETNKTVTEMTYDENGNEDSSLTVTDGIIEEETISKYNADGTVSSETAFVGDVELAETKEYDVMGRLLKTTDEVTGCITTYKYDECGRVIQTSETTKGITLTTTSSYDKNGTVIRETDEKGVVTAYEYDDINRLVKCQVTKEDTAVYHIAYSYADVQIFDGRKQKTMKHAYKETQTYPNGEVARETYTAPNGMVVKEKSNGLSEDYSYDKSGNQIVSYCSGTNGDVADGTISLILYNEKGNAFAAIENPKVTGDSYSIGADTILTGQEYDDKGNLIAGTDPEGIRTAYEYDDSGRTTKIIENAGAEKESDRRITKADYTQDTTSNTISTAITDANGHISQEIQDAAGLIQNSVDHGDSANEKIAASYEYDNQGNKTKVLFEDESYKTYSYDARNLLIDIRYYDKSGTQTLQSSNEYNHVNQLISMTDSKISAGNAVSYRYTKYGYDAYGRLRWAAEINSDKEPTKKEINQHKISYHYDLEGKIVSIEYAMTEGQVVKGIRFTYDHNRRLTKAAAMLDSGERTLRTYTYDTMGRVSKVEEYPGFAGDAPESVTIVKSYQYDVFGRVTSMEYKKGNTTLEKYTYQYDKNSNIIEKHEINHTPAKDAHKTNMTTKYTYSAFGELIKSVATDHKTNEGKTTFYTYDRVGNRMKKTEVVQNAVPGGEGVVETTYTYNGLNQLMEEKSLRGSATISQKQYTYDDNGNQVKEADSITKRTAVNEYDGDNRLSKTTICETNNDTNQVTETIQENRYNGNGQRIMKKEKDQSTHYFYQDGVVSYTMEGNADAKVLQNLLGLEGNVIAAERKTEDSQTYYLYNKDIQDSTTSLIDETGLGQVSYRYSDFGETTIHDANDSKNEICYTGGIYDQSSGLYYLNARYYDAKAGRFLTQDTYRGELQKPYTLHLYAYCEGNPINYTDPTGHWSGTIHKEITKRALTGGLLTRAKFTLTKKQLKYLQEGSVKPDKAPKMIGKGEWHSRKKKSTQMKFWEGEIKDFRKRKNKKSEKALIHLGTILHSVQDFYAHAYHSSKEDFANKKNPTEADKRFHSDYARSLEKADMREHRKFKDNDKQDWINNKWVERTKFANKRYTGAVSQSEMMICQAFGKKK